MKIQVGGLSEGLYRYRFDANPVELGLSEDFSKDVVVVATLEKTGNQLYLKTTVEAFATFECDRCTSAFESALSSSYRMFYLTDTAGNGHIDPSEVQLVPPGFSTIELTEDVRQTVLLSVPLKRLCSERCAGLCPRCGKNLNIEPCACEETVIDSRWEKLRSLQGGKL